MLEYDARKKSMALAYVAWLFLGFFGVHRFYLKRTGSAAFMLLLALGPIPLAFAAGFLAGLGGARQSPAWVDSLFTLSRIALFGWWLVDAFLIPGMTQSFNLRLARQLELPAGTK